MEDRLDRLEKHGPVASTREESNYWTARSSLRICPVKGSNLKEGVGDFLREILLIDESLIARISEKNIRKPPARPGSKFEHEVVVRFDSVYDRDNAKAAAFRLAGNAGHSLRLELPTHLLSQHRLLSEAGQKFRQSNAGGRTNLRFDDEKMQLVLDFKGKDGVWKRLRPEQAREVLATAVRESQDSTSEEFASLLGNFAPLGSRERRSNL